MFSRRPGARNNRGRIATGGGGAAAVEATGTLQAVSEPATSSFTGAVGINASARVQVAQAVITLGGTMLATGGGPAVTLTGTLLFGAGLAPGIKVEITTNGTAGAGGAFRVSYDSGATWAHSGVTPIPATYALDGAAEGATLNFSGAYTTSHSYEGTVATIRSTEGNSYTFTQATAASQPVLVKAAGWSGGQDALRGSGGAVGLHSTDAALVALITNDPALTTMGRVHYNALDATAYWFCAGDSAQSANRTRRFGQNVAGAGRCRQTSTNDAAGATLATGLSTPDPNYPNALHTECWKNVGANGAVTLMVDDASVGLDVATQNVGTLTPTRVSLLTEGDSAPANGHNGYLTDFALFNSALPAADITMWHNKMVAGT